MDLINFAKDKNFDGYDFYLDEKGSQQVRGFKYKDPGSKVGGSSMGDLYDIVIYPDGEKPPELPDRFQAILSSPIHYVERMIENNFSGIVGRVTTTSDEFMNHMYEQIKHNMTDIIEQYEEFKND